MAGHSKWKNIQHRKGSQDAKKGKVFTKIAVEIMVAVRASGPNPEDNPRLRLALTKARAANMPKDNQIKAIKKGSGEAGDDVFVEKSYEGYGPGGVALIVECLTNNINRTVGDVRFAFTRSGGNLGTEGSVNWMFERKGLLIYEKEKIPSFDALFELATENGADDVKDEEDSYEVICDPAAFNDLKAALDKICEDPAFCEITMIPKNFTSLDEDKLTSLNKLVNALEDNDDVQNVYHNAENA